MGDDDPRIYGCARILLIILNMRNERRSSSSRRGFLFLGALLMFGAPALACTPDFDLDFGDWGTNDPRTGNDKRVIFSSGCASSVTMPIGARETITVTAATDGPVLPKDLTPKSSDATVIEIENPSGTTFEIRALKEGQTDLEVWNGGTRYDWLTFHATPATQVNFVSESSVLAGGQTWVVLTDVFGQCGKEQCTLFGHGFMQWSAEPAAAFASAAADHTGNIAHYRAETTPGMAALVGKEPSAGVELVRQTIEVVDPTTITAVDGFLKEATIGDEPELPEVSFPATVRPSNAFSVRVFGTRAGKSKVAIARPDIEWTVPAGIEQTPIVEPSDIYATQFSSTNAGAFTLTAKIPLLGGKQQAFVVTVKAK